MTLTLPDVMRFMRAQTKGDTCFSCGENHWGVSGYGKDGTTFAIGLTRTPDADDALKLMRPLPHENVVMLVCDHCGFVRLHRYEHVRRWCERHPEESDNA
jgi:predicted RNA-binding Zn-ribbon protein involved in translation (DUF1610 family)